jgi:hypothetical protein
MRKTRRCGLAGVLLGASMALAQGVFAQPPQDELPVLSEVVAEHDSSAHAEEDLIETETAGHTSSRLWLSAEYLLWWFREGDLPPLVTTGSTIEPRPGALGSAGTRVLFGGAELESLERSGGRFGVGLWLNPERTLGLEISYLFVGSRAHEFARQSPGEPVLARPFFDVTTGAADASLITFPGLASGSIAVDYSTSLDGVEANLLAPLWQREHWEIDGLLGFRYLRLEDDLRIEESVDVNPAAVRFGGQRLSVRDQFDTTTDFYGAQIGMRAKLKLERLSLAFASKVAFGDSSETVRIRGRTTMSGPPASVQQAGLLALASNSGRAGDDQFAVVPEASVQLGFEITPKLRATIGYTFLYWSDVVRSGSQIDLGLNPALIPTSATFGTPGGPARPALTIRETDFWAQGLSFGLEYRY